LYDDSESQRVAAAVDLEVPGNNQAEGQVRPNGAIGRGLRIALKNNLKMFRIGVWCQEGLNQRGDFFGPQLVLQDKVIGTLVQKAGSIQEMESLAKALEWDNISLRSSVVIHNAPKLLAIILSTCVEMHQIQ
jgi:hypothetical protein